MPKATVIVPVYNVEAYLEKCVDSILAQTEPDFELLLVDDGSTDNSGALCDKLAQKDSRIQVIHQKNQGLGGARNTGIKAASGDWVLLVDSDDWIEPELLEKTLEAGLREEADLVMFGFRSVDEQGNTLQTFVEDVPTDQGLTLKDHPDLLLTAPSAWRRLYRRELLVRTGILYPPRVWYEDIRTTPKLLAAADRVVFLSYVGYDYLSRTGSITKNQNADRNQEILWAFDDLLPYFQEQGLFERYRQELCYLTLFHAYLTASVRVLLIDRKHPLLGEFRDYLNKWFPDYRRCKYLPRLSRVHKLLLSLLEKRMYGLVALLFRLKGRLG
jgi:glycosyltransferase involved in cell wall biosynthesis